MNELKISFEQYLNFKINQPLNKIGTFNEKYKVNYIKGKNNFDKYSIDFLTFKDNIFPPKHLRIDVKGNLTNLENFQYSIMYESGSVEQKIEEEKKMKIHNKKTAMLIINKGLAKKTDEWIDKYL